MNAISFLMLSRQYCPDGGNAPERDRRVTERITMATQDLRHIYGQLDTGANDPVGVMLLEALIAEIERLEQRISVLERVREFNER